MNTANVADSVYIHTAPLHLASMTYRARRTLLAVAVTGAWLLGSTFAASGGVAASPAPVAPGVATSVAPVGVDNLDALRQLDARCRDLRAIALREYTATLGAANADFLQARDAYREALLTQYLPETAAISVGSGKSADTDPDRSADDTDGAESSGVAVLDELNLRIIRSRFQVTMRAASVDSFQRLNTAIGDYTSALATAGDGALATAVERQSLLRQMRQIDGQLRSTRRDLHELHAAFDAASTNTALATPQADRLTAVRVLLADADARQARLENRRADLMNVVSACNPTATDPLQALNDDDAQIALVFAHLRTWRRDMEGWRAALLADGPYGAMASTGWGTGSAASESDEESFQLPGDIALRGLEWVHVRGPVGVSCDLYGEGRFQLNVVPAEVDGVGVANVVLTPSVRACRVVGPLHVTLDSHHLFIPGEALFVADRQPETFHVYLPPGHRLGDGDMAQASRLAAASDPTKSLHYTFSATDLKTDLLPAPAYDEQLDHERWPAPATKGKGTP